MHAGSECGKVNGEEGTSGIISETVPSCGKCIIAYILRIRFHMDLLFYRKKIFSHSLNFLFFKVVSMPDLGLELITPRFKSHML